MGRTDRNRVLVARASRGGFTLIEALIAASILAIVSATAALPFAAGLQQTNEAARLEQAVALGQAMMEEILARPFFDPSDPNASLGPELGETSRMDFNNIDDFHGFAETAETLSTFEEADIKDASADGFWRTVTVEYVSFPGLGQAADDVNGLVHVQVRVYHKSALMVTLDRLVSREN